MLAAVSQKLPAEFLDRIKSVKNKRARLVLDRIAERGSITTEELAAIGYNHAPRARMDARDLGFPIKTVRVKSSTGKSIAAYSFDLTKKLDLCKAGRVALSKRERERIIQKAGRKCQLCGATHDLQIDHRVPYEIAGESLDAPDAYMVLCGSCNRRKSWICEHCDNFTGRRRVQVCHQCYWASPEAHTHVAMQQIRRTEIIWEGQAAATFDDFQRDCKQKGITIAEAIKALFFSRK
jgi:hypothetical protein